jgi:4'-phosphopantetheinyl transferase
MNVSDKLPLDSRTSPPPVGGGLAIAGDTMWLCEASLAALRPWAAALDAVLDGAERARAARFAFAADRERHLLSHGLLRHLLARACGGSAASLRYSAASLRYSAGPQGKPALAITGRRCAFNLSHAGDRLLIVVTASLPCGVDIEPLRAGIAGTGVEAVAFSVAEREWIAAAGEGADADERFTRCWVRKEALLKAWGLGLSFAPDRVDTAPTRGRRLSLVAPVAAGLGDQSWSLMELDVAVGYHAAVAVAGPLPALRQIDPLELLGAP